MTTLNYINLTNGIEYIPEIKNVHGYIRIQSTACEQKRWWFIIRDLDYSFLLSVALGNKVIIYDTSAHKNISRALFQGVEWVKYVLNRYWLGEEITPVVHNCNCKKYFNQCYEAPSLERGMAVSRLKYIKKLINPEVVDIDVVSKLTYQDGDYEYFSQILRRNYAYLSR